MAGKQSKTPEADLAVPVGDIPLPPDDVLDKVAEPSIPEPAAKPDAGKPEVAALEFEDDAAKPVPLKRPFRYEGELVKAITVRPLLTAEYGDVIRDDGTYDRFDAYALMTGLPAPVLRGLDARDGEEVTGIAYDFLPRLFRANRDGD